MNKLLQIALVSSIFATAGFAVGETPEQAGTLTINGTMNVRADYTGTNPVIMGESGELNIDTGCTYTSCGINMAEGGQLGGKGTLELQAEKKIQFILKPAGDTTNIIWDKTNHNFSKWPTELGVATIKENKGEKCRSLKKEGDTSWALCVDDQPYHLSTQNEVVGFLSTFIDPANAVALEGLVADYPDLTPEDLRTVKDINLSDYNLGIWNTITANNNVEINARMADDGNANIPLRIKFATDTDNTLTVNGKITGLGYLSTNGDVVVNTSENLPQKGLLAKKLTVESEGVSPLVTPGTLRIVLNAAEGDKYGLELKKDITVNGHLTFAELTHSYGDAPADQNGLNDEETRLWEVDNAG